MQNDNYNKKCWVGAIFSAFLLILYDLYLKNTEYTRFVLHHSLDNFLSKANIFGHQWQSCNKNRIRSTTNTETSGPDSKKCSIQENNDEEKAEWQC